MYIYSYIYTIVVLVSTAPHTHINIMSASCVMCCILRQRNGTSIVRCKDLLMPYTVCDAAALRSLACSVEYARLANGIYAWKRFVVVYMRRKCVYKTHFTKYSVIIF